MQPSQVSFMLAVLTHLLGTVFATGPRNLCLRNPGPFSLWQCQFVLNEVAVLCFLTIYLITLLSPKRIWSKEILLPCASDLLLKCLSVITASINSWRGKVCACANGGPPRAVKPSAAKSLNERPRCRTTARFGLKRQLSPHVFEWGMKY